MNLPAMSHIEFATLLRRQSLGVYVACEKAVADDLSATLTEAADRIIKLQREDALSPHNK